MANDTLPTILQMDFITPESKIFSGTALQVQVPGVEGDFGVLPGHAPFISMIRPGIITIDTEGEQLRLAVTGGIAEVIPERCTVLAENALDISGITKAEAEAKFAEAKMEYDDAETEAGRVRAEKKIEFAEAILLAV